MYLDPLTGVLGRDALNKRLLEIIESYRQNQGAFSLVLLDLDHFKSINDAFGHLRGDQVLAEFGRRLGRLVRRSDLVFRYGGDEFVILLLNTNKLQASRLAERLLEDIRSDPFLGQPDLTVSLSMGVASFPQDANTAQALFELADQRHYIAKRQGRGRVVSEDLGSGTKPLVVEPSRLVERDQAMNTCQQFLSALGETKRGVLQVVGEPGSGKSRFLRETFQAARLRGYLVIDIHAQPALRGRVFGALTEALIDRDLPSPWQGVENFVKAVEQWLLDKGSAGFLILVDDLPEVDQATFDFLREFFYSPSLPQFGLVYTTSNPQIRSGLPLQASMVESVNLGPLSIQGMRIWMRHAIQWEAPQALVDWLYQHTGGWPKRIQQSLDYLVSTKLIYKSGQGWQAADGLYAAPISEILDRRLAQAPNNLPAPLSDFVGRENQLQQLKKSLQNDWLVSVVGPGGIGKTRLAVQAARESLENFPNGVFLVYLAAFQDVSLTIPAIADALHFTFSGPEKPEEQLLQFLHSKEMLLVLDSFRYSLESNLLLDTLRKRAPGVRLLVTANEPLGLPGETVFELEGLPTPLAETLEESQLSVATQLFLSCARRTRPDFKLDEQNSQSVVEICRIVDGMPLGIELAASWVGSFSPEEIARYIETTVGFLATEHLAVSERHRSLLNIFDSFCSLLSESELSILRQLSVFRGGFGSNAARQVAGASPFYLDGLAAKANLRRLPLGRYELHSLWWQYAREKLLDYPQEQREVLNRHSLYFAQFVQQREHLLTGSRQALEEITAEIANLRAAWEWSVHNLRLSNLDMASRGMAQYFTLVGLFQEGEAFFAQGVHFLESALEQGNEFRKPEEQHSAWRLLGWLLVFRASFLKELGRSGAAPDLLQQALEIALQYGDPYLEALALLEWGRALMVQDLAAARDRVEQALQALSADHEIERKIAASLSINFIESIEASCYRVLGILAARSDSLGVARDYFERALKIQHRLGNLDDESNLLNNLGLLADMEGRRQAAREYFLQSLENKRMLGNLSGAAKALHNLGLVASHLGDYSQARKHLEEALAIWRDTGNWSSEGKTLNDLGDIALRQGYLLRSIQYQEQALSIHMRSGNKSGQGEASESLGDVFLHVGDFDKAEQYLSKAYDCYLAAGDSNGQASVLAKQGGLAHAHNEEKLAIQYLKRALKMAKELGNQSCQALAYSALGKVYASSGELKLAIDSCQKALDFGQASGEIDMIVQPLAVLAQISLKRSDLDSALQYAEKILEHIQLDDPVESEPVDLASDGDGELSCANIPGLVYLACYQALEAVQDRRAEQVLEHGNLFLRQRARRIGHEVMKQSFLTNIEAHQQLLEASKQLSLQLQTPFTSSS
jgi:diguanylate cyclase (GGDEF)-like protein